MVLPGAVAVPAREGGTISSDQEPAPARRAACRSVNYYRRISAKPRTLEFTAAKALESMERIVEVNQSLSRGFKYLEACAKLILGRFGRGWVFADSDVSAEKT